MSATPPTIHITVDTIAAAWNSHDPARLADCFTPDGSFEDVPLGAPTHGRDQLIALFTGLFAAFPDLVMTPGKRVEQGEMLAWEWIITGTHRALFQNIPATNRAVQLRGASFCVLRGGKIAENREYWDLAGVLQQLGVALTKES